jgi:hypothetical protein
MRYLVLAAVLAALLGSAGVARADIGGGGGTTVINLEGDAPVFSTEVTVTDETDPDGGITTVDPDTGVAYPSGCRQVDVAAVAKSIIFRTVIYKFHQVKHWCWHKGIVYDERHAWSFQGSATACFNTAFPANAWFFSWRGFAQGGHFSEEHAWVTNCVFKVGAWNQLYPDVKISAHADGTYESSTSN